MLESSNIARIVKSDGSLCTTAAYAITLPSHKCFAKLDDIKALGCLVGTLGVEGDKGGGKRRRGVRLSFFGTAADNQTITGIRIYAAHKVEGGAYQLYLLMTLGSTLLGNIQGATGLSIGSGELGVDTIGSITNDAEGYYAALKTALDSPDPQIVNGTDTLATLIIPDVGGAAALVYDIDLGTATGAGVLQESMS